MQSVKFYLQIAFFMRQKIFQIILLVNNFKVKNDVTL
jgi:hypothetical protein